MRAADFRVGNCRLTGSSVAWAWWEMSGGGRYVVEGMGKIWIVLMVNLVLGMMMHGEFDIFIIGRVDHLTPDLWPRTSGKCGL